jgi:hypothetical protein
MLCFLYMHLGYHIYSQPTYSTLCKGNHTVLDLVMEVDRISAFGDSRTI